MHFIWPIFFNTANTRYLLLLMCIICANVNKVVANSGYTNICFMINIPLKMLTRRFPYFHCSNFKMTFVKNFIKESFLFLTSSKFLLCCKIFRSGNSLQLNDYRKCPFNNSGNFLYLKWRFFLKDFFNKCNQILQFPVDLVTFTQEIINEKLHFLWSDLRKNISSEKWANFCFMITDQSYTS